MKKIYTIIATVGVVASSFAQMTSEIEPLNKNVTKSIHFDKAKFGANKNKLAKTAGVSGGWFNYGYAIDVLNSNVAAYRSNYLFPDSIGKGEFGTGNFVGAWVHHLGDILDVKGIPFQSNPLTAFSNVNNPYVLDSMSIEYVYTRKVAAPTIPDTLVFTIFNNSTPANLVGYYFDAATAASYGTDTLSFKTIKYTQATNKVNATSTYKFKVLLTPADSSEAYYAEKRFKLPLPFIVPSGKLLVTDVQFVPGYTYTEGTHIDDKNAFYFASFKEKGTGIKQTFYDCNSGSAACDWNVSSLITQSIRYNTSSSGWNGLFIPSYGFSTPTYEHHLISYRLTETVGVNDLEKNGFALGQNTPNPFTNGSAISYQLVKDAKSVLFTVTDVMGRVISTETASNSIGIHTINIGSFAAGVYYYSLNVDGNVITKKMIAQ